MTIKRILTAPDPFLKQISKPVDSVTKEIQDLMDDMLETRPRGGQGQEMRPLPPMQRGATSPRLLPGAP